MRWVVTLTMIVAGFALQIVSYFLLGARIGIPQNPSFSNPRLPYAALSFIAGVVLVFVAAIVYELLPDEEARGGDDAG